MNEDIFLKYKWIQEHCLVNGILLPVMLSPLNIPKKYRLTSDEKDRLVIDTDSLRDALLERNRTEQLIVSGESGWKTLGEYWDYELRTFIKDYQMFGLDYKDFI